MPCQIYKLIVKKEYIATHWLETKCPNMPAEKKYICVLGKALKCYKISFSSALRKNVGRNFWRIVGQPNNKYWILYRGLCFTYHMLLIMMETTHKSMNIFSSIKECSSKYARFGSSLKHQETQIF